MIVAFDRERVELVDLLSADTLLTDRPRPQEARQPPAKPDGDRPLQDRVADARRALYGDKSAARAKAAAVKRAMQRSGRV